MPLFEEERAYCFAHVGLSVCPSVTFSFSINNWRTPWPTFLKLGQHILDSRETLLILASSNLVQTSILGSKGTFLILGSTVKVTGVK